MIKKTSYTNNTNVFTPEEISLTSEEKAVMKERLMEAMGLSAPKLAFARERVAR